MKTFEYVLPTSLDAAAEHMRSDTGAQWIAGGTNLVDLMKLGVSTPATLVDVTSLPLDVVELDESGHLRIGATVRNSELAANPLVRERYPVLPRALLDGASGQLRNMATTAGNLLQRTRCGYFMDLQKACNKREPGSGCSALAGNSRGMAILGASAHCVATHPSDMAVAMAVLDPRLEVVGPAGRRDIAFEDFYRLPGEHPSRDTTLGRDDLVVSVRIPALPAARNSTYRKVRDRASFAFALVSVAAVLEVTDGHVVSARIALGGVAHKPWRAYAAERALIGRPAVRAEYTRAMELELSAAEPMADNAFKVPMITSLTTQTLVGLTPAEESSR